MPNKLQLKCLATDRPAVDDTEDYAFFFREGSDKRLIFSSIYEGTSWYAQTAEETDKNRFFISFYAAAAFLADNKLIEAPKDSAELAHAEAHDIWINHKVCRGIHTDPAYDAVRKAFIKQRVEAQGVVFSEDLYDSL